jgi:hypothetical protein
VNKFWSELLSFSLPIDTQRFLFQVVSGTKECTTRNFDSSNLATLSSGETRPECKVSPRIPFWSKHTEDCHQKEWTWSSLTAKNALFSGQVNTKTNTGRSKKIPVQDGYFPCTNQLTTFPDYPKCAVLAKPQWTHVQPLHVHSKLKCQTKCTKWLANEKHFNNKTLFRHINRIYGSKYASKMNLEQISYTKCFAQNISQVLPKHFAHKFEILHNLLFRDSNLYV